MIFAWLVALASESDISDETQELIHQISDVLWEKAIRENNTSEFADAVVRYLGG